MAIRGIKTKIAFNVATLVLLSALITDGLLVMVVQGMLVRQEVAHGRHALVNIGRPVMQAFEGGQKELLVLARRAAEIAPQAQLGDIEVSDVNGVVRYRPSGPSPASITLEGIAAQARRSQQAVIINAGVVWSTFWWRPQFVHMAVPILIDDRLAGSASGIISLEPIYQRVSKLNKPILFYLLINTIILTMVGLYRIFKLYLRPIDRIVRQADDYHEDGGLFFAFRQEDNQLNRLSSALNRMLSRIKADKETLKKTVVSLEQANAALKEAQKKIIQAEKMASVGRLASGIAHEIGNPIGIVLGYLDLLKKSEQNSGEEKDFIRRAEEEVQRINRVIRQLLDLARPKDPESQRVDLNLLIEDIMVMMRMQPIMSRIQISSVLDPGDPVVWGNADQLRQVFLNLLLNSADAIQSHEDQQAGRIHIQSICLDEKVGDSASHVQIHFEDNGTGMAPETLDNMFDPFYTTKEPGKGTGLGLAVSYMIIEGLGGELWAESKIGKGTTFTVALPLAKPDTVPAG